MKHITLFLIVLSLSFYSIAQNKARLVLPIGHTGPVYSAVVSPDGKYVLSGSGDKTMKLWDMKSGKEVKTFKGHKLYISSACFLPDGKKALTASADKTLKLWDIISGNELKTFTGHEKSISSVCISPNGKYALSSSSDKTLKLWDIESGKEIRSFVGHNKGVTSASISPDGKIVLSGSRDNTLKLWDIESGQEIKTFTGHESSVYSVCFSPDGKYALSAEYSGILKLWDIEGGNEVKSFKESLSGNAASACFSRDGKYVLGGYMDNILKLWDIASGKKIKTFKGHTNAVKSVGFSLDGKFALSSSVDKTIKLWDVESAKELKTFKGEGYQVTSVSLSPNGKYALCGSYDNTIKLWDIKSEKEVKKFIGHKGIVYSVSFSPDGKYALSGSGDKTLKGHTRMVKSVCFSPDGKSALSASYDKTMKLWDIKSGRAIKTFKGHTYSVYSASFSPNGKYVLSASTDNCILWNIETGEKIKTFEGHSALITNITFSPDGKYALSCSWDNTMILWDIEGGQEIRKFEGHTSFVESASFSPDGKFALSASLDNTLKLWDIETGNEVKTLKGHVDRVTAVCFSPDGKFAVSSSDDNSMRLWNIESGKEIGAYITVDEDDWLITTPDGYWSGSNNIGEYFAIVKGLELWNIDQFAVQNNRPDIVLQHLGSTDKQLTQHYKKQYKKRLRKLGLTESQIKKGYHTPDAKITKSSHTGKLVDLEIKLSDSKYNIKSYNIYVNDVPVFGVGKKSAGKNLKINEKVELTQGRNKIEVSCMNSIGTESFRDVVYYSYENETQGDLYLLAIGVSNYKDSKLNLAYAHKDALDLEQVAKGLKGKGFENVYIKTLVNEQVTTANIKAAKDFVKNAKVDDTFILFIAGHGMHDTDEDATYYYLTHNTDLKNLKGTAATFETIEDLLQGIPPRNKLFLMDACESGELDPDDEVQYLASATEAGVNSRGFKKTGAVNAIRQPAEKRPVASRSYLLNRNRYIYNDLVRRSGAIVFSSSKGGELSYERSDIENGLFTEYIMKALTTTEADADKDGTVSTDELRNYVSAKVAEVSDGLQHPTVDRDNIYQKCGFKVN